jgi:hypothetical protein
MTREEAIQELLMAADELYTHYWEGDDPRSNPVSFEISEVYTLARLVRSFDKPKDSKNKVKNLTFISKAKNTKKEKQ